MLLSIVVLVFAAGLGLIVVRRDYRAWRALGDGGLPGNFEGWLRVTYLRMKKGDPLSDRQLRKEIGTAGDHGYLDSLPERNGPRPKIAPWPIPHRQCDQFIASGVRRNLDGLFDEIVAKNSDVVHYKQSYFERHSAAVTLCADSPRHPYVQLGQGEIAHIHPRDGSMHMIFSPSDALKVIEGGWGERHPLAGVGRLIPSTYIYVYPPRDEAELEVVSRLLDASVAYMTNGTSTGTSENRPAIPSL